MLCFLAQVEASLRDHDTIQSLINVLILNTLKRARDTLEARLTPKLRKLQSLELLLLALDRRAQLIILCVE